MLSRAAARVAPAARNLTAGYTKKPLVVTITGAAGNIGYALAPRILNGEMLGADQPVILKMLELPGAQDALEGCKMELDDCAFPLAHEIVCTADPDVAFEGCDYALLVGAAPRGPGMERADLLQMNAKGFKEQGQAIDRVANKTCKVVVTGNPANTNCLVAASWAKSIPATNFSALTRLDHNRGLAQLSEKFGVPQDKIEKFAIWGNHSPTMYPDTALTSHDGALLNPDAEWLSSTFIPDVQQRGAAIIKARGKSSAMSAASATIDHARDLHLGSATPGVWNSMAVLSSGEYGFTEGIYTSFPVLTAGEGEYSIIKDVPVSEVASQAFKKTDAELVAERDAVVSFMP